MRIKLQRNWYAHTAGGDVLYESKFNPIELPDNYDETLLPSTAMVIEKDGAERPPKRAEEVKGAKLAGGATFWDEAGVSALIAEVAKLRAENDSLRKVPATQVVPGLPPAEPVHMRPPSPPGKFEPGTKFIDDEEEKPMPDEPFEPPVEPETEAEKTARLAKEKAARDEAVKKAEEEAKARAAAEAAARTKPRPGI